MIFPRWEAPCATISPRRSPYGDEKTPGLANTARAVLVCGFPSVPPMTLELTDSEFQMLLHAASLSLYVAEPNQAEDCRDEMEQLYELTDRLFALGEKNGFRGVAQFDSASGHYVPTEDYLRHPFYETTIREFEDDFFWNELAYLLAERDLRVKGGQMDPVGYNERLQDLEDAYMDHFSQYGVDRLHSISVEPHQ